MAAAVADHLFYLISVTTIPHKDGHDPVPLTSPNPQNKEAPWWTVKRRVLTLSLALGRVTALAAGRFLQVIGLGAAAAAQSVRLIATLSKRRRTLRLEKRKKQLTSQVRIHRFGDWLPVELGASYLLIVL